MATISTSTGPPSGSVNASAAACRTSCRHDGRRLDDSTMTPLPRWRLLPCATGTPGTKNMVTTSPLGSRRRRSIRSTVVRGGCSPGRWSSRVPPARRPGTSGRATVPAWPRRPAPSALRYAQASSVSPPLHSPALRLIGCLLDPRREHARLIDAHRENPAVPLTDDLHCPAGIDADCCPCHESVVTHRCHLPAHRSPRRGCAGLGGTDQ